MSDDQKADAPAEKGKTPDAEKTVAIHKVGDVVCAVYRIESVITGPDGEQSYKASHTGKDSRHLIRPIAPALASDSKSMEQVAREAGLLRYLEQEAVADYEGVLRDESGRDYLIMEAVEGPSLTAVMERGALAPETVLDLRTRLGRGLMAAHEYGLIHRDLTTDKVILQGGEMAKAKIVGFGLLQAAESAVKSIETDAPADDIAFAAPEQLGLFGGTVDARTDIYSFGLVLAAAALGRPLDQGKTTVQLLKDRQSPPDLSALPDPLRAELEVMLQPDPKDRPSSLGDLIVAEEAAAMAARLAPVTSQPATSKQPKGARGWVLAGGVIALVAVIGLVANQFSEAPPEETQEASAPAEPAAPESEEAPASTDTPVEEQVAEAPAAQEEPQEETQAQSGDTQAESGPAQSEPQESAAEPEEMPAESPAEVTVAETTEAVSSEPAGEADSSTVAASEPAESSAEPGAPAETEEMEAQVEVAPETEPVPASEPATTAEAEPAPEGEGLLPPPGLPTSLQDVIEETPSSEPETAPVEPVQQAEAPEAAETESADATDSSEQVAALPPGESEEAAVSASEQFDANLGEGQRRQVQRALQALGFYDGAIDGIIGQGTRSGIAAFQESIGAEQDGFVSEAQLARLNAVAPAPEPDEALAEPTLTLSGRAATPRQPTTLADALQTQQAAARSESVLGNDFEWLMRRALGGDRTSQRLLASRYQRGQGGAPLNLPEAVKWYRLAAEQGDPKGQYNLGLLYESGTGVPQDYDEAAAWFAKAAQKNVPGARARLDSLYSRGLAQPPS